MFHIDDDLLNVPIDLGQAKQQRHNDPLRRQTIRHLLDHADLVYCSTRRLKERLLALDTAAPIVAGEIYCSGRVLSKAVNRPVRRVGYMGFDHQRDFEMILPALVQFLRRNPQVEFELLGSISKPPALEEFGDRIKTAPPVRDYEKFLGELARREWDVGLCPLTTIAFNLLKADTKWVEYTSVGAAVIASRGTVYDDCCSDGRGVLADSQEEWLEALEGLSRDPERRFSLVARAQRRLVDNYSIERLRRQALDVFEQAGHFRAKGDAREALPAIAASA